VSQLERILGIYVSSLFREAEKLAKIRALELGLEILKGWRKITLSYFYAVLSCTILVACGFSMLIYNLTIFNQNGRIGWDFFNLTVGSFGVLNFLFLMWSLREERWLSAFNIEARLAALSVQRKTIEGQNGMLDEKKLADLIDRALEKKLEKLVDERIKTRQKPAVSELKEVKTPVERPA